MAVIIREAKEVDVLPIQHFIAKAGFQTNETNTNWELFHLAINDNENIVACVALEPITEKDTMIRTLILDSNEVNGSFLLRMLETAFQLATKQGADTVYLVAAHADEVLLSLGFQKVDPSEIPKEIQELPNVPDHTLSPLTIFRKSVIVDN
ncbi:GNAT family N-acetyltransferase [Salipaludibacillus sp. CF4.18]|uniref:GNAT family N-acetyltransferase n=1 Tax=Salipaludibacillus sp. CF4.18 TaxID=3373081 RepID=UPI003EE59DCF